jgi:hypothetical protein
MTNRRHRVPQDDHKKWRPSCLTVVSAFMQPFSSVVLPPKGQPRPASTYRCARRATAKRTRADSMKLKA